jgi:calcineurin-like phosphoesterase family protein
MATFFISDTHFGHANIMKYCHRPHLSADEQQLLAEHKDFRVSRESVERMDSAVIDAINAVVGPKDTLWHLGDFAFTDVTGARNYRDRITCQNVNIIWGNHDKSDRIRHLFDIAEQQILTKVDDQWVFMNHYPMLSYDGSHKGNWQLFGHVHGNIRKNPIFAAVCDIILNLDVGVDGPEGAAGTGHMADHRFRPWSMDEVNRYMNHKMRAFKEHRNC